MSFASRFNYYRRIFRVYLVPGQSQLTFWHESPQMNPQACFDRLGEYYMSFHEKADYSGQHDSSSIPMLNYHGHIGLQYNPIAIAQWGLGNYNLYRRTQSPVRREKLLAASEWLCRHLEQNPQGLWVWNHHFDWEYRTTLKSPWQSGLAQGQGISLLLRAHAVTGEVRFLDAANRAFQTFLESTDDGGVCFTDERGDLWFEEYIVSPPTHILNGFIWAIWGIHDYYFATGNPSARSLIARSVQTLGKNLERYDLGFWSLYEESGTRLPMVASPFYHRLHIVQLRVMHRLTGEQMFADYADRWEGYAHSRSRRTRAFCYKGAFKLCHY
jgi:heparosan-N-sulfate-glucuronate 5-epimerase